MAFRNKQSTFKDTEVTNTSLFSNIYNPVKKDKQVDKLTQNNEITVKHQVLWKQ